MVAALALGLALGAALGASTTDVPASGATARDAPPDAGPAAAVVVPAPGSASSTGARAAPPPPPAAAAAPAAREPPPVRLVRQSRTLFGTLIEIMAWAGGHDDDVTAQLAAAFDEIRRIEAMVDENNPRSAVFRINAGAGADAVVVEPELFFVLTELARLGRVTNGAFDVTAAALSAAWRFDGSEPAPTSAPEAPRVTSPLPTKSEIDRARKSVGLKDLVLDAPGRTVKLAQPGARIALRTLARGHALERAADVLEQKGLRDVVISAAGDLVVRGKKGDKPWTIGVQDPRAAGYFAALPASRGAVMTTGDYEEFFFDGGTRYHNVLDPRSGLPATQCRAVTALAPDALTAEAVSRAVFVLGPKEGLALAERLKVEVVVVTGDNKVVMSRGLRGVVQVRAPTDGP